MLGKPVPDFSLPSTGGILRLSSTRGGKVRLYFYPQDLHREFQRAGCLVFGVMKQKSMYGKKVRGIERSTFVLDANGVLAREWRGVKVPGHAQEVLNFVKTL